MGEAIWVSAGVGWVAYGMMSGSIALVCSGVAAAVTSGGIVALVRKTVPVKDQGVAFMAAIITGVCFIVSYFIWGFDGLSVSLSLFGIIQFIPQLIISVKLMIQKKHLPGVSTLGTFARSLYAIGWTIYALGWVVWGFAGGSIDWPLVTWGIAGSIAYSLLAFASILNKKEDVNDRKQDTE